MRIITIILFHLIYGMSYSQKDTIKYCNPKLEGMGRSKGVVLLYEHTFAADVKSTSSNPNIGNSTGTVQKIHKLDFDVKFPIWNKPRLKAVLGIRYFYEEYNFKNPNDLTYPFYKLINNGPLKSLSANLTILKPVKEFNYFILRSSWEYNGNYQLKDLPNNDFLKYNVALVYGWKPCPTRTWGLGLYFSYTFGRKAVMPVFIYNVTFNKKWGLEAIVPIDVKMRHNFSEKTLFYFGYDIQGTPYHLVTNQPPLSDFQTLELRRSVFRLRLEFDQEIHDWLWFGITTGIKQPIAFNLFNGPGFTKSDRLIHNIINSAGFFNVSIFVVPPRTLENRLLNGKDQ